MTFSRPTFKLVVTGVIAMLAGTCALQAQAYPTRPVRFVVGFTAGGSNDIVARLVGQRRSISASNSLLRTTREQPAISPQTR
jgi:tripartite-type tricarboxylate transporter receptor subunit TctC